MLHLGYCSQKLCLHIFGKWFFLHFQHVCPNAGYLSLSCGCVPPHNLHLLIIIAMLFGCIVFCFSSLDLCMDVFLYVYKLCRLLNWHISHLLILYWGYDWDPAVASKAVMMFFCLWYALCFCQGLSQLLSTFSRCCIFGTLLQNDLASYHQSCFYIQKTSPVLSACIYSHLVFN